VQGATLHRLEIRLFYIFTTNALQHFAVNAQLPVCPVIVARGAYAQPATTTNNAATTERITTEILSFFVNAPYFF